MPTALAAPGASSYVPPRYRDAEERSSKRTLFIYGACAVLLIAGGAVFVTLTKTREMREYENAQAMIEPPRTSSSAGSTGVAAAAGDASGAQSAAATLSPSSGANAAGAPAWRGGIELPGDNGTIKIQTLDDQSMESREFASSFQEPASLAVISIDNSPSKSDLVVDTTHSVLQFADGTTVPALNPAKVYGSSRGDASATAVKLNSPPYVFRAGEKAATRRLFMPKGTDTRQLSAITLEVNGQMLTVRGTFGDAAAETGTAPK